MLRVSCLTGAFVLSLALSGCATLNEDQCTVTDWQQLGQAEGARGVSPNRIAGHNEACAKFGLPVDAPAWQTGWQTGIRQYCTFENGVELGRRGTRGSDHCPADLAADFRLGNDAAKRVNDARVQRDNAQRELERLINAIADQEDAAQREVLRARVQGQQRLIRSYDQNLQLARDALQTLLLSRAQSGQSL